MKRQSIKLQFAALALCLLTAGQVIADSESTSSVPPAIQEARRAMLDSEINVLTFQSMDKLFYTREVSRSGPVWRLPRRDTPLDFSYEFEGEEISAEAFLERTYTNALMIIKDGVIVSEIYRNLTGPATRFIGWSMTKSITSALIGCALEDGHIESLDDPVTDYLPELADGAYRDVTIRQVLEMRSGVDYEERYDFENPGIAAKNHENSIVRNVTRFADAARDIGRSQPPGTTFAYKTIDTAVLGWLLERATGMSVAAYLSSEIWEPLGAHRAGYFILDGPPGVGREFTGAGFNATLNDFGLFGQMILDDGVANGQRVLPEGWVSRSTAPVGAEEPPFGGYGYQWWTAFDSDAFMAIGLQGQYVYVDPETRTVVVKLSYFPPGDERPSIETAAFLRAASAWQVTSSPGQ